MYMRVFSESHSYDPCMSCIVLMSVICRLYENKFKPKAKIVYFRVMWQIRSEV